MRVPVNPTTNVSKGQVGYERNVDVSSGTKALGAVVSEYGQYLQGEQKKRELFDVSQQVVDETNNIQQDFEARQKAAPLGADGFTQTINTDYQARHEGLVKELKDRGYSDDAVQEFATRLGTIRAQYVAKAIDFQDKSNFTKQVNDADALAISLSQHAQANPSAVGSALDEFKAALTHTDLDAMEQARIYQVQKDVIVKGAQEGFVLQHPEVVLGLYAPHEITTTSPTNLPQGQQFDLPQYLNHLYPAEGTGKNPRSSAKGYGQFLDSTWLGTYKEVFGKTKETDAEILAKKTNSVIAKKLTEKLTNDNVQGLVNAGAPVNSGTVYLAHFLGINDALKVISAHSDETISKLVRGASIKSNPGVFKNVQTAGDLLSWAQDKMGVDPVVQQAALKPIPKGWKGNIEDAIQELGMTAEQATTFLETGQDTRQPPSTAVTTTTVNPYAELVNATGQTGIPILDLASGPERMQMITQARVIMNERENDAKAAQRAAHEEWLNGFLNQVQDGKLGQADINAAYTGGLLTDFDERKKVQGVFDDLHKKNDDLERWHVMLSSGQKFNPYDKDAQKAADAGFTNTVKYSAEHGVNADPFVVALRQWQRTGILPSQGAVMIRGGLVGTDPQEVAGAASVASNMLKENPNAFAGVDGGEEIGKAATTYTHYVDDLGMSAQDAANKIAQMNSPEFQTKQKFDEPQRNAFINTITGDKTHDPINIEKVVNDAVLGKQGWGSTLTLHAFDPTRGTFTDTQKAEASQTYLELALDHFDKYHDPAAAQAYAERQMSRFYGVDGDRIVKYPANKAYPEIQGNRDYVLDQAKNEVDKFAGFPVAREDIFLQPTTSGSTAAAFRSNKPAPYEIHFVTHEDGQTIYHYIPGKVFVADVDQARRDAAIKAREVEKNVRAATDALVGFGVTR